MNDTVHQILIVVIAGLAAYFGAYFKRKGENKALQEDFDEIRRQLQTTTRDTEAIRQQLANHSWLTQQQWSAREQLYSKLLRNLHRFDVSLMGMAEHYLMPGSEYDKAIEQDWRFKELLKVSNEAITEVEDLRGTAAIFLSGRAIEAIDNLLSDHWNLARFGHSLTAEYVKKAEQLASAAYTEILTEAKAQLRLSRTNHPYSTQD